GSPHSRSPPSLCGRPRRLRTLHPAKPTPPQRDRCPDETPGLARLRRIDRLCHHASLLSRKLQNVAQQPKPPRPRAGSSHAGASPPRRCALLFASATATTSGGRRWRSPITPGSALVAFDRSKLALAPLIRSRRKYGLPRLDIPPRRCLPPVEFCRGTRPSQAANSRPLRKPLGSTTVAAMAVAMIGPMPGTLARRWLTGLL